MSEAMATETAQIAFYRYCRRLAREKGYSLDVVDDFPAWALARRSEGAKGSAGQLLIDYLRVHYGVSHSEGQQLRRQVDLASEHSELLEGVESERRDTCPEYQMERQHLWNQLKGQDRAMLVLSYRYGLTNREIADVFGISEGRVSQLMARLIAELRKQQRAR